MEDADGLLYSDATLARFLQEVRAVEENEGHSEHLRNEDIVQWARLASSGNVDAWRKLQELHGPLKCKRGEEVISTSPQAKPEDDDVGYGGRLKCAPVQAQLKSALTKQLARYYALTEHSRPERDVEKQVSDLLLLRDSEYNELLGGTSEKDSQALRKAFQQNEYTCGLKNDGECVVVRALANRTRRPPNVRGPSSIVDLPPEREGQCLLTVTSLQQDPLQCIKKDATSQNSAAWQRLGFALPDSASLRRDPRGYRAQEAWARLAKMRGLRRCGLTAEGTCSSTDDPESEANGCVATMTKGGAVCVERDPAVEKVKEKKRADFSWKEAAELTSTLRNNGEMPCALNSRGDPAEHGTAPEGFCVWKDELLPKREAGGITRQTADERCVGTLEPKTGPVCLRSVASVVETMRRLSAQARRLDAARRTNV